MTKTYHPELTMRLHIHWMYSYCLSPPQSCAACRIAIRLQRSDRNLWSLPFPSQPHDLVLTANLLYLIFEASACNYSNECFGQHHQQQGLGTGHASVASNIRRRCCLLSAALPLCCRTIGLASLSSCAVAIHCCGCAIWLALCTCLRACCCALRCLVVSCRRSSCRLLLLALLVLALARGDDRLKSCLHHQHMIVQSQVWRLQCNGSVGSSRTAGLQQQAGTHGSLLAASASSPPALPASPAAPST